MNDFSHIPILRTSYFPNTTASCFDIGAAISVIGQIELREILFLVGHSNLPIVSSRNYFRFGNIVVKSFGYIELCLQTYEDFPNIMVFMDTVPSITRT